MRGRLRHLLRVLLGLYVAGSAVVVSFLLFLHLSASLLDNSKMYTSRTREGDVSPYFERQMDLAKKQIDVSDLNGGDWTLICLLGRMSSPDTVLEAARARSIRVDSQQLQKFGPQKSLSTLLYVRRDAKVDWTYPSSLQRQLGSGEVLCVSPESPVFQLPTEKAVRGLTDPSN